MQAAIDGRGEKQACRPDEQTGHGIERRQRLERHARAALHRDENRGRDKRASRKNDRERR